MNWATLVSIADLPGLPGALAATLNKVWHANIDLAQRATERPDEPRLATLARLEQAVLERLPRAMLRPGELARRAILRFRHIDAVLGTVECGYLLDIAPCWSGLIMFLY